MKATLKQEKNINFYINNKANSVYEYFEDIKIVTFTSEVRGKEMCSVMIWKGRQQNPFANYYFSDIEKREEYINKCKKKATARIEYKAERAAERKAFKPDLKIGDIYVCSWGYEQTNVDFYQVVEVKGKSTAVLKRIAQERIEDSIYSHGMAWNVLAVKDSFLSDETITKRVGQYGINLNSYSSASKWDGSAKYVSTYY